MCVSSILIIIPILLLYTVLSQQSSFPTGRFDLWVYHGPSSRESYPLPLGWNSRSCQPHHPFTFYSPGLHMVSLSTIHALMSLRALCPIPFHSSVKICLRCHLLRIFCICVGCTKCPSAEIHHMIAVISVGPFSSLKRSSLTIRAIYVLPSLEFSIG